MNFVRYVRKQRVDGERPALIAGNGVHTYAELAAAIDLVHGWLLSKSVSAGERVLIIADNSLFFCAAYLGAMQAGAVVVPITPNMESTALKFIANAVSARALFIQHAYLVTSASALKRTIPVLTDRTPAARTSVEGFFESIEILGEIASQPRPGLTDPPTGDDDLAAIMFTSGSTGTPRGVMVSHGNLRANTESIVEYVGLTASDRMMAVLPFSYCFGASLLHTHLAVGGAVVIGFPFMFPDRVLQGINFHQCTGFAGVPSHFQILLRRSSLPSMTFPTLRFVQQAGGKLPGMDHLELAKHLPTTRVFAMYGQTEATARLSYLHPEKLAAKSESIGQAIPGVTLTIEDETGREVRVGEVGEIVVQGANVTKGYWNDPVETAKTFRNGKLHTGDMAYRDADGDIFVVDRAKNFLKLAGHRVSTLDLEQKLGRFPGVVELAVVPMSDPEMGEAVKLFLVHKKSEAALEELTAFSQAQLRTFEQPRRIVFLNELPKLASGKIDRSALRQAV